MYETTAALNWVYGTLIPAVHGGGDDSAGAGVFGMLEGLLDRIGHWFEPGHSAEFLPGIQALGLNQHPLVVHFPIAFLCAFFVLEIIATVRHRPSIHAVASWMLYLGAGFAVLAAGAGLIAAERVAHGETVHAILEWHERLGLSVATLALTLSIWRAAVKARFSPMARSLHLCLAAIMVLCLVFAADLGGLMVYQHGVGVKQLQSPDEFHHHHAAPESIQPMSPAP